MTNRKTATAAKKRESNSYGDKPQSSPVTVRARRKPQGMTRVTRKKAATASPMIAYDFETTRIRQGTPRPLYLTAYGENPDFSFDGAIRDMAHLRDILVTRFLTPELKGARFVAWNANNFDAYFVAAALLETDDYVLRPYLTKNNSLRGLKVILKGDEDKPFMTQAGWEFLDGMAMLGLAGTPLTHFLKTFAPEFGKLEGVINFETEEFNPRNKAHQAYAMRDSVGLYKALMAAQSIMLETFNQPLTVTLGNACIKIFKSHIPVGVTVKNLPDSALETVREFVMRGGFCFCKERYHGPVWKYDLNQAYAAAMRDAPLPCGAALHTQSGLHRYAKIYMAKVSASKPGNKIPFYYRTEINGRVQALFASTQMKHTWLTSIEVQQLKAEGWKIEIHESWTFENSFNMREYVDKLELIRTTCEGGPSGAIGTVMKAVGNHSYGKTVEQLENIEYLIAKNCPPDFAPYYADGFEPIDHVFFRFTDPRTKDYHQPHVGSFITAYVRMVVRRAALLNPEAWLYADTDCVVFSADVTGQLDVDPKRYGAWKIEEAGTVYRIIAKKVYQNTETLKGNAKGLNVKKLKPQDFVDWYEGTPPVQDQVQRQNFVKVMAGAEMFRSQTRHGTSVEKTK